MEEQIPQTPPPPVPAIPATPAPLQSVTRPKTFLVVILGLVLLLGVLFAGAVLGKKGFLSGILPVSRPLLTPTTTLEPTPTPDPAANWETYTNEKYGFSLKYPPSWQLEDATGFFKEGGVFSVLTVGETQKKETEFYDGARLVVGLPLKTSKTIKEWVKGYYPAKNINDEPNIFSEESINGKVFQKVHACGLGCYDYFNIISSGYVYRIMTFSGGPEKAKHEVTLDQILSTFKFLDQASSTKNWKTYTNPKDNFSVKYPDNWFSRGRVENSLNGAESYLSNENSKYSDLSPKGAYVFLKKKGETDNDGLLFNQAKGAGGAEILTIDGQPAVKNKLRTANVTGVGDREKYAIETQIFYKNQVLYEITLESPYTKAVEENETVYDQILSSFKFIE